MNVKNVLKKLKSLLLEVEIDKKDIVIPTKDYLDYFVENQQKTLEEFKDGTSLAGKEISKNIPNLTHIDLNDKVDDFIDWYYKSMDEDNSNIMYNYRRCEEMRNFIEKMAVWYELRYPKYEIEKMMMDSEQEQTNINKIMFENNPYINDLLDKKTDIKVLDWDEFYNANVFIKSLSSKEKCLLDKPSYENIVYLYPNFRGPRLYLTKSGIVKRAEYIYGFTNSVIENKKLEGMHVKKIIELFKIKGIKLPENNELEKEIKRVENLIYQKEEMLNCVMYRIIERGGNRIGPRRAFIFAKEFGRNIDIPMQYGVDYLDSGLRNFINEYIKAGGSKELECYIDYFSRINKEDKLDTISIQDLILTCANDAYAFYTPEEDELHQRLVDVLSAQIDKDIVQKEEAKVLRLERKLKKSKINK